MTRNELLTDLQDIGETLLEADEADVNRALKKLNDLIEEIESSGVLDVQCPKEIAEGMGLPVPATN